MRRRAASRLVSASTGDWTPGRRPAGCSRTTIGAGSGARTFIRSNSHCRLLGASARASTDAILAASGVSRRRSPNTLRKLIPEALFGEFFAGALWPGATIAGGRLGDPRSVSFSRHLNLGKERFCGSGSAKDTRLDADDDCGDTDFRSEDRFGIGVERSTSTWLLPPVSSARCAASASRVICTSVATATPFC